MTRQRLQQHELLARMPRVFRPKLASDQVRDLGLAHIVNLDAIATGDAGEAILWQYMGGVLTWSRAAQLLGQGEAEMAEQVALLERLIERFQRTGRVVFTGPEYQLAKDGVLVMDLLAAVVDRPTAVMAADWGERRMNDLAARGLNTTKDLTP